MVKLLRFFVLQTISAKYLMPKWKNTPLKAIQIAGQRTIDTQLALF